MLSIENSGLNHFTLEEFACPCGCGTNEIQWAFVKMLDDVREIAGFPFTINSGYRCPEYDKQFGGKGNHTSGWAADIAVESGAQRFRIVEAAAIVNFDRIGVASGFVHLDKTPGKPQEVLWVY